MEAASHTTVPRYCIMAGKRRTDETKCDARKTKSRKSEGEGSCAAEGGDLPVEDQSHNSQKSSEGEIIETKCGEPFRLTAPEPGRNKKGELVFEEEPEFRPNRTPKEVLQAGSFGGTYFRTIRSSVSGKNYLH